MTAGTRGALAGTAGQLDLERDTRAPRGALGRSFRVAMLLGWRIEGNWTDPVLFFIYSVAKPVASALILVAMLEVIGGGASQAFRSFVVVGSGLWAFVIAGISGLAWAVLDDRERYRMLKYVYVSPSTFLVTLLGRGVARLAVGAMGAAITLAVGVLVLGVEFDLARMDWFLLGMSMVAGLAAIVALGIILAAVCLQTRQESRSYPEAVAGALFLIAGAVFPLAVLPAPAQAAGLAIPVAWWIEGVRRAVFPNGASGIGGEGSLWTAVTGSAAPDGTTILLALLGTGAVGIVVATVLFGVSERRAKDRGLLDRTTGS